MAASMAFSVTRCIRTRISLPHKSLQRRSLRSDTALEAIARASEDRAPFIVLYNYPYFSGALSALFAHLFHSRFSFPCLILPFSSVLPLRIDDLRIIGIEKCYLLDFVGPPGFALQLSRTTNCEVICFDHRKSTLKTIESPEACLEKVKFHVDVERSSSRAVYEYFSSELKQNQVGSSLLDSKDQERVELLLSYIEDVDLRRWRLKDINAFKIGMGEWRSRMNCITNPFMFDQLMELKVEDLVSKGNSLIQPCKDAGKNVLDKAFKLRLGKGIYGECLAVRADGNSHLSDEIGKELSLRSSAAGLRPIGAVIYMQRNNLKMCLRSVDSSADTSEIAKAYGGGGRPSSSSFIIRMDEYNQWLSVNASCKA
ncbi:hypothetical protein V2J09_002589 [Rumex salicifolius]